MCFVCYRFCQYNKSLLTSNKNIVKVWKAHVSKWGNYVLINSYYKSVTLCELEKVSFNFSEHSVTKLEKSLLTRGLNFALPCKDFYYAEYILPFELLFRDVNLYEIPSYNKLVIRSRLRDCALTSFRYSGNINKNNLFKEEHLALKDLMKKRPLLSEMLVRVTLWLLITFLKLNSFLVIRLNFREYPFNKTKFWNILYIRKTGLLMFL